MLVLNVMAYVKALVITLLLILMVDLVASDPVGFKVVLICCGIGIVLCATGAIFCEVMIRRLSKR